MDLITKKERKYIEYIRNNTNKGTRKDVIKFKYLVFKAQIELWIQNITLFIKCKQVDYTQWKLNRLKKQLEQYK